MNDRPNVLELDEADLRAYAVKHGDALVKVLQKMKDSGRPNAISWSWFGFLLPFAWFAYRRMWGWLIAVIAVIVGLTILERVIGFSLGSGPGVGISVAVGMMGKQLVIQRAARAAANADAQGLRGDHRAEFLAQSGGVNPVGAWIFGILTVGLFGLAVLAIVTQN